MSDLAALIARVRANPGDDASWLVMADRLAEEGDPLGEYIALSLKYQDRALPEAKKRRLRKLGREWQARSAPWATFVSWGRWGIWLRVASSDDLLAYADELRRLRLPLRLEVEYDKRTAPDACVFDEGFTRLAWMRSSTTVENANFSPGMDEDWHYFCDVKVWRVADRAVLFERSFEASFSRLEFRAGGLFGIDGESAVQLYGD